jgi:hypothetical protein
MPLLRITEVAAPEPFTLRLRLTDGTVVERDVAALLIGPVFERVKNDPNLFRAVRAEAGAVLWPNGADLCPDVLIWGGPPPADETAPPAFQTLAAPGEKVR